MYIEKYRPVIKLFLTSASPRFLYWSIFLVITLLYRPPLILVILDWSYITHIAAISTVYIDRLYRPLRHCNLSILEGLRIFLSTSKRKIERKKTKEENKQDSNSQQYRRTSVFYSAYISHIDLVLVNILYIYTRSLVIIYTYTLGSLL